MITRKTWFTNIYLDDYNTVHFVIENVDGVFEENPALADLCSECYEYMEVNAREKFGDQINGTFVFEIVFCKKPGAVFLQNLHSLSTYMPPTGTLKGVPYQICEMRDMPEITPPFMSQWRNGS